MKRLMKLLLCGLLWMNVSLNSIAAEEDSGTDNSGENVVENVSDEDTEDATDAEPEGNDEEKAPEESSEPTAQTDVIEDVTEGTPGPETVIEQEGNNEEPSEDNEGEKTSTDEEQDPSIDQPVEPEMLPAPEHEPVQEDSEIVTETEETVTETPEPTAVTESEEQDPTEDATKETETEEDELTEEEEDADLLESKAKADTVLNIEYHTQKEIISFIQSHPIQFLPPQYDILPNKSAPYAVGRLTVAVQNDALNVVNQLRYIAGLSYNVVINQAQADYAQAATMVNAANNVMSHYPDRPAGLSDDLYAMAEEGASSSNLGMGYRTLADAVFRGWIADADRYNIDRVGHRRWVLNPYMISTGFGQTDLQTAMYSFGYDDQYWKDSMSGKGAKNVSMWPGPNMPVEYFASYIPWSYSTGEYEPDTVSVTLTKETSGQVWHFSKDSADGYFNVENSGYGIRGCIIFRPTSVEINTGDRFLVEIKGLSQGDVRYHVNFFDAYPDEGPKAPVESVELSTRMLVLNQGDLIKLNASVNPANAVSPYVNWSVDKPNVATVDSNGIIHAIAPGYAVVTAVSEDGSKSATAGVIVNGGKTDGINMYRLYNPNSGEHFYTGNINEVETVVDAGWNFEGLGFVCPQTSKTPVYRLYNPNAGDHHYTTNLNEKNHLVKVGWNYEGIGWYADDKKTVTMHRLYNPNATGAGSHHYTSNVAERDYLVKIGWRYEGVGFYSMK